MTAHVEKCLDVVLIGAAELSLLETELQPPPSQQPGVHLTYQAKRQAMAALKRCPKTRASHKGLLPLHGPCAGLVSQSAARGCALQSISTGLRQGDLVTHGTFNSIELQNKRRNDKECTGALKNKFQDFHFARGNRDGNTVFKVRQCFSGLSAHGEAGAYQAGHGV